MLLAVLRRADEHLHQVVVQAVEDLALEGPLKLRVVDIARMQLEVVGMYRRIGESRPEDDFNGLALGAGVELDQWVLVEPELLLDARQTVSGHAKIVDESFAGNKVTQMLPFYDDRGPRVTRREWPQPFGS